MGTYALPDPDQQPEEVASLAVERTSNLLHMLQGLDGSGARDTRLPPILLGSDAETGEEVSWKPDPSSGSANPHVLILGESGFGKTYTIASLSAELAQENVVSRVFGCGQGFSPSTLTKEFVSAVNPSEQYAGCALTGIVRSNVHSCLARFVNRRRTCPGAASARRSKNERM